jgi:hypothetical protein
MDHADFIHAVRLSEFACAEQPAAYRRQVAAFAALGYAWVALCLVAAMTILGLIVPRLLAGHFKLIWILTVLGALGLAWSSLKALWVRVDEQPDGVRLGKAQAPALFKAISRVRRKVEGPRLDEVWLNDSFNASITQIPRHGLLGGHVNRLHIGLPLMMALDGPRLSAVLAHEYGHLRGGHGRFAAWIYRSRLSWSRLNDSLEGDQDIAAFLTTRFMQWYVPRFLARSFALARQDEYEADSLAAQIVGPGVMGAALIEIEVKGIWLGQSFWRAHWQGASAHATPQGPFKALRHLLAAPPEQADAQDAFRQAMKRLSNIDDTHPVLRDRLDALKHKPQLPAWSARSALALLGDQADKWIAHFDQDWCRNHASGWKALHARQQQLRERVAGWAARADSLGVEELVHWADCERRLAPGSAVASRYEEAWRRNPSHPGVLRGLLISQSEASLHTRLGWLETLWEAGVNQQHWAARHAVHSLEQTLVPGQTQFDALLKLWRQRLKTAQAAEQEAWDELGEDELFARVARHDLNELELDELCATLSGETVVEQAWLVNKRLISQPQRRAYLLLLDLGHLPQADAAQACRGIEHQLHLPGPVTVLCASASLPVSDINRHAFGPVYSQRMAASPDRRAAEPDLQLTKAGLSAK